MHYAALVILGSDVDPADESAVNKRIADIFEPYYSDRPEGDPSPYPELWDWYEVGGRYADRLTLRDHTAADVARAGDVDWPAMSAAGLDGRTYAVLTREGVETRETWDPDAIPAHHDTAYRPHDCAEGWCRGAWLDVPGYAGHWDQIVAHLGPSETVAIVDYHN